MGPALACQVRWGRSAREQRVFLPGSLSESSPMTQGGSRATAAGPDWDREHGQSHWSSQDSGGQDRQQKTPAMCRFFAAQSPVTAQAFAFRGF